MGEEPKDIYRETLDRTWANVKRQHFPSYVFREGVEPVAYQIFVGDSSEVIHEACAKDMWDREFPLYSDDIEAMRNLEPIICDRCEQQMADSKELF